MAPPAVGFRRFLDRRTLAMLPLGFSSGLPLLLVLGTFTTRLAFSDIDIKAIGLLSYVALPYSLKFLWAPAIDRLDVPLLSGWLGRRRAWMVASQLGTAAAMALMAFADPRTQLPLLAAGAFLLSFAAATQDAVIDGWRIKAAGTERQGIMVAVASLGYRLGLIVAGAGALFLAARAGWTVTYLGMAALMAIGFLATLFAPRVDDEAAPTDPTPAVISSEAEQPRAVAVRPWVASPATPPRDDGLETGAAMRLRAPLALAFLVLAVVTVPLGWAAAQPVVTALLLILALASWFGPVALSGGGTGGRGEAAGRALAAPVAELASRYGVRLVAILLLVALFRMPDFVSGVMASPLYRSLGYSLDEIATVTKLYGIWVGMAGTFAGGWIIARFGLHPALVAGGAMAAASHLALAWLSLHGADSWAATLPDWLGGGAVSLPWRLAVAVSVENFCGNFAGLALVAFMSGLVAPAFAASQYALLSSLYALPGKLVAGLSGFMVASWGYPAFFAFTAAFGIPVTILAVLFGRSSEKPATSEPAGAAPAASTA